MQKCRWFARLVHIAAIGGVLSAGLAFAQGKPAVQTQEAAANQPVVSEKELAATQEQLIKLLRMSPTLTNVVSRDPSLLSNSEYVSRNNPELARFLQSHPEIARNPDFYLFTNLERDGGGPSEALERKVWPELPREQRGSPVMQELISDGLPFLVFLCILGALLWLTNVILENRRWGRIFRLQSEVHNKVMDKFASSQELLGYMNTDVGKRFLEAAPIPVGFERSQPVPSPVARVLTPLQIGIVMVLLGVGLLSLRSSIPDGAAALLVVGIVVLMPGLGFIISAGITWFLARHLGLMPQNNETRN
jgi:hypothetical protein